jgi:hypothetical protein
MLIASAPPSKDRLAYWIKKEDLTICCLQETHLTERNKLRLRVKE